MGFDAKGIQFVRVTAHDMSPMSHPGIVAPAVVGSAQTMFAEKCSIKVPLHEFLNAQADCSEVY
eukprot:scaffold19304_cov137-Amphora_coffeaeformis.AAC.2